MCRAQESERKHQGMFCLGLHRVKNLLGVTGCGQVLSRLIPERGISSKTSLRGAEGGGSRCYGSKASRRKTEPWFL